MRPNSFNSLCGLFLRKVVFLAAIALGILVFNPLAAARNTYFAGSPEPTISYVLDLRNTGTHLVVVQMYVPQAVPATEIQFPAWNALYQIRDFVRNVENLTAKCDGRAATMTRVDLNTWQAPSQPCAILHLSYRVFLNEEGIFSSVLNSDHCYLNLAMALFYLPQERHRGVHIEFELPAGWELRTLLDDGSEPNGFTAANYDALVDCPVEAAPAPNNEHDGEFHEYSYIQDGATFRAEIYGNPADYAPQRLLEALRTITATETAMMDDVPFSRYTFILHFPRGAGGGGMEHRNGTAISVSADSLKNGLDGFESVAAHEFFHAWNVKRIRPQNLEPVDYVHGNDTRDLWFSEGVTSTYGELTLLRSGLISRPDFYHHIAEEIYALQRRPARLWQSLETSGREAWLEKYPDYHQPERSISYYNKGELVGFLLDLAILHASLGHQSLDDVMRGLNTEFAKRGRFFSQTDLRFIILNVAPGFDGIDQFFQDYLTGTQELNYETYLNYAGLHLIETSSQQASVGFRLSRRSDGAYEIQSVELGSKAEKAGLRNGDVITELNGEASSDLRHVISSMKSGQRIELTIRRETQTLRFNFPVGSREEAEYQIEEISGATPEQLEVRSGLLAGTLHK